ncbi:MAG TPA: hypothetical protein VLX92_13735 [Kofleriaceae bacterium]|nr:hypothetical protein [Kofleriaceae bacterium]
MTRAAIVTCASIVAVTVTFAAFAWQRRWISDDGLIVVRIAEQIESGHGPVINRFERAEANTSALWPWLVAAAGELGDLSVAAVVLGGLCAVAGLLIALDATRRWQRARGCRAPLVPGGAWIVLGMFPFWDYATAGLETGLVTLWIGASWWLLVALRAPAPPRRQLVTAIALGLGLLVRPDLAPVVALFLVAAHRLVRPTRRRAACYAAAALALPLAYEVFRAGYYGALVPLPALAKATTGAHWSHGLHYLAHFVVPYALWLPLGVLAALLVLGRRGVTGPDRTLVAAPIVAGLVLALYVVRIGGDFMHGRMLIAPALLVVLPALVVPLSRRSAPAIALLAAWCAFAIATMPSYAYAGFDWSSDWDERDTYVRYTENEHPIHADDFVSHHAAALLYQQAVDDHAPPLVISDIAGLNVAMRRDVDASVVMVGGQLGTAGEAIPLDGIVADIAGLASPLGARITPTFPGRIGHEKQLPWAWVLAQFADPRWDAAQPFERAATVSEIRAARHALTCGELAELLASAREPLTAARFWDNLTGAWRRTWLEIPSDPIEAERAFCR